MLGLGDLGRLFAIPTLDHLGRGVNIFHDEDNILESKLLRVVLAFNVVFTTKEKLRQFFVGLDAGQWNIDNVSTSIFRNCLNETSLSCTRRLQEDRVRNVWSMSHHIIFHYQL